VLIVNGNVLVSDNKKTCTTVSHKVKATVGATPFGCARYNNCPNYFVSQLPTRLAFVPSPSVPKRSPPRSLNPETDLGRRGDEGRPIMRPKKKKEEEEAAPFFSVFQLPSGVRSRHFPTQNNKPWQNKQRVGTIRYQFLKGHLAHILAIGFALLFSLFRSSHPLVLRRC
jgi:hypothetical protein